MLSIVKLSGLGGNVEKYMGGEIEGRGAEDYYAAESGRPVWSGGLAKNMGLDGLPVESGELTRALSGYHPRRIGDQDVQLAKNAESDDRKLGWDCTFSARKSVSIAWALAAPEARAEIEAAQQRAVDRSIHYLETHAATSKDRAGDHAGQPVGGLLAATYQHGTSREGDPQLHTHTSIANLAQRPDGTYSAIDLDMRHKMAAGALYRAELASELQKLGYGIEKDGNFFRIADISEKLENEFSKRSQQIRAQAAEEGKKSQKQLENITRDSRKAKELTPAELKETWEKTANEMGYRQPALDKTREISQEMPQPDEFLSKLLENNSTISAQQLRAAIYIEATGKIDAAAADLYFEKIKADQNCIKLEATRPENLARGQGKTDLRFTDRATLEREKFIAQAAKAMSQDAASPGGARVDERHLSAAIKARPTLSVEQKAALEHITASGRCAVVQGSAGAGKSYMLDAAREAWEADGRQVMGCAISGKAAAGLEESAKIKSDTIAKLLIDLDNDKVSFNEKTVLVMDEAGMTGSRQMHSIMQKLDAAGGKLVLVGDTRQLQPVDAGGSMRAVQEQIGAAKMDEIRRQKNEKDIEMVKNFAAGKSSEALNYLKSENRLIGHANQDAAAEAISKKVVADLQAGRSSLALSDTRASVQKINELARAEARSQGLIKGKDQEFKISVGSGEAKTEKTIHLAAGERVMILKNDKKSGVKNGQTGEVLEIRTHDKKLCALVRMDDGREVLLPSGQVELGSGYAATVHKSQGATVDAAYYLPGSMADRELAYVAASRHRHSFEIHTTAQNATPGGMVELAVRLAQSHGKINSTDFKLAAEAEQQAEQAKVPEASKEQPEQILQDLKKSDPEKHKKVVDSLAKLADLHELHRDAVFSDRFRDVRGQLDRQRDVAAAMGNEKEKLINLVGFDNSTELQSHFSEHTKAADRLKPHQPAPAAPARRFQQDDQGQSI